MHAAGVTSFTLLFLPAKCKVATLFSAAAEVSECAPSCTVPLASPQLLNGVLMGGLEQCPRREVLSIVAVLSEQLRTWNCKDDGESVQRRQMTLSRDTKSDTMPWTIRGLPPMN